jgi:hypothetical protein
MRRGKMQNESLSVKMLGIPNIKWDLETKKEVAKIGMAASMVVVVGTSFAMNSKTMKTLHIGAGATLVGFSLWHHFLYQPSKISIAKNTPHVSTSKEDEKLISSALVFKEMYTSIALE